MAARPVLVTGGAGFIGSHCVEALLARGERVVVLDDFDGYYDPAVKRRNLHAAGKNPLFRLVEGDIRDEKLVADLCNEEKPDRVLHLAARAGVRPSLAEPELYRDVNVHGTEVVLEAARAGGATHAVLASSSSVYGERAADRAFKEDDPLPHPESPYAQTKQEMEEAVKAFQENTRITATCLRFFTVYGPRQRPDMAIHKFVDAIENGRPVTLYGDGRSVRDYTYISDIVSGILAALDRPSALGYRVYNLGEGKTTTLSELVAEIEAATGKTAKIEWKPMQSGDVSATFADTSRAVAELGYRPTADLPGGIRAFVEWYRAERANA